MPLWKNQSIHLVAFPHHIGTEKTNNSVSAGFGDRNFAVFLIWRVKEKVTLGRWCSSESCQKIEQNIG